MRVVFTPHARDQLRNLREYIAGKSSPARADTYITRLLTYCEGFATFPRRGTARDDLEPGLRTVGFERRVTIAFVVAEDAVYIAGVYYGGRDFEAEFTDDEP